MMEYYNDHYCVSDRMVPFYGSDRSLVISVDIPFPIVKIPVTSTGRFWCCLETELSSSKVWLKVVTLSFYIIKRQLY